MTGESYRLAIAAVLLVGLAAGGAFLLLFKPRRWLRDATARDASGWVIVIVALYAWVGWQTVSAWVLGIAPPDRPLAGALAGIGFGLALDGFLVYRLRRYMAALEDERIHPTRICPRCGGAGVVPLEEGA